MNAAYQILAHALVEYGVGAKTHAGYGRMSLAGFERLALLSAAKATTAAKATPAYPQQALVDDFIRRLAALPAARVAGEMNTFYQQWKTMSVSPGEKKRAAQAIEQKVVESGREKASSEKSWFIEVRAAAKG